ncbi:hypothetical protein [Methylobacterium nigriterrae]|uniref:hypothetical protein n=1 Tax=Methylobacterium nigriterrae TaxID=3127512 RepID=UPI003013B443
MVERPDVERSREPEDANDADVRKINQEIRFIPPAAEILAMEPAEQEIWERRIANALF